MTVEDHYKEFSAAIATRNDSRAIQALRQILRSNPSDQGAIKELDRILRKQFRIKLTELGRAVDASDNALVCDLVDQLSGSSFHDLQTGPVWEKALDIREQLLVASQELPEAPRVRQSVSERQQNFDQQEEATVDDSGLDTPTADRLQQEMSIATSLADAQLRGDQQLRDGATEECERILAGIPTLDASSNIGELKTTIARVESQCAQHGIQLEAPAQRTLEKIRSWIREQEETARQRFIYRGVLQRTATAVEGIGDQRNRGVRLSLKTQIKERDELLGLWKTILESDFKCPDSLRASVIEALEFAEDEVPRLKTRRARLGIGAAVGVALLSAAGYLLYPFLMGQGPQPPPPPPPGGGDGTVAAGELSLPMPGKLSMVFCPVFLGLGEVSDGQAERRFETSKDPNVGENVSPTKSVVKGPFKAARDGRQDRIYYMGKYEVTEDQFSTVMAGSGKGGGLPARNRSFYEITEFIRKYNDWLRVNALKNLPKTASSSAFVCLPTDAEWEFAARGGVKVSPELFNDRHPYFEKDHLNKYEWFEGASSSHGAVQKVGLLKPNPLGLYDMLGNVSELAKGGSVMCGGNFRTNEAKLAVWLRGPVPEQRNDGTPFHQEELGFRLMISANLNGNPFESRGEPAK